MQSVPSLFDLTVHNASSAYNFNSYNIDASLAISKSRPRDKRTKALFLTISMDSNIQFQPLPTFCMLILTPSFNSQVD